MKAIFACYRNILIDDVNASVKRRIEFLNGSTILVHFLILQYITKIHQFVEDESLGEMFAESAKRFKKLLRID